MSNLVSMLKVLLLLLLQKKTIIFFLWISKLLAKRSLTQVLILKRRHFILTGIWPT